MGERTGTRSRRAGRTRGLRFRVVAAFALGGLLLSAILAGVTYGLATRYLVQQREQSATRQTYLNARLLRDTLRDPESDVTEALERLELSANSSVVVHRDDEWFGTSVTIGRDSIPTELRAAIADGEPAHQRVRISGKPFYVVGIPIASVTTGYFEVFSLDELEHTLGVIRNSLLAAAAATTVAAGLVGLWAGRRVLRPLTEFGTAARDITEGELSRRLDIPPDPDLAPLAESFNRMVEALQRRIERDARFASDVSHELRSPLMTLRAATDVLQSRLGELPPRLREPMELVVAEVRSFERLVSELLELARADADVAALEYEPVRIGELVLHSVAARDGPPFLVEIDPELADATVLSDKRRLDRILANLVENASTHGRGLTRIAATRVDGRIRLEVEDRGDGVPESDRGRVFERFFRGDVSGQRGTSEGSGLGLALVAEHVRLLEGRAWVEDGPNGRGARFVVELPRRDL
jgi:signal transduction histidine kinase